MTYEEFRDNVYIKPVYSGFLRHNLKKVEVSFRMYANAEYTDKMSAQMDEDEFVEWVVAKTYEKLTDARPFAEGSNA